jgi:hypothetical protein
MTFKRMVLALIPLAALAVSLAGCGGKTQVTTDTTTTGRELQDLEDARAKGILNEEEYNRQRKQILKGK